MNQVTACEQAAWHLHVWPLGEVHGPATDCHRVPFACRSWRHAGPCRQWRGALDWYRVAEGIATRDDWVYVVLTFKQPEDAWGRWQTYARAGKCWDAARKRLTRRYGRIEYIQTWERHRKGGCHCNAVLGNPELCSDVELDWRRWRRDVLRPIVTGVGFGPVTWCERCDNESGRLAGYMTKLAAELTGSGPKNQVPEDAPPHFRRIRASRGLLPRKPDPELTGELVRAPIPEYDDRTPPSSRPCGCGPRPGQSEERKDHAT